MLTSKKDETEQRLNALLQRLSGITFVPEQWNEEIFWTTIEETGFTKEDVLNIEEANFFQKFIDLQWPWEQIEHFADILVASDNKKPNAIIKERAKNLYQFIQKESKMFSFQIACKINRL